MALPYRIRVNGALDDSWPTWFDGLTLIAAAHRAAAPAASRSGQPDDP